MGMFDELTCDYPLPDPAYQHRIFQTKSLECQMTTYRISAEGRLLQTCYEGVYEDDPTSFLGFRFLRTREWEEDAEHEGLVLFYDFIAQETITATSSHAMVHYLATFRDGNLIHLREISEDESYHYE